MNDYEPLSTTKIGMLIAGMRATAAVRPIWTQDEAAKVMGVARSSVPPYLVSALSHRLLFRRAVQGGLELSLTPFEVVPSGSNYVPYTPTKTEVPRPGSDTPFQSGKPPNLCTGCSKAACWDNGCQEAAKDAAVVASAPAPTQAPTPVAPQAPPLEEPAFEEVHEEEEEVVEPKAFIDCETGEIVLIGCPADEEGRVTIPAALVERIKTRIAWSPVR